MEKKIIIFSAFSDTARYLYENIHQWAFNEFGIYTALITGSDSNKTNLKSVTAGDINDILWQLLCTSK